jgi:competence protein ComEC
VAVALGAVALGAWRMDAVIAPALPAEHVARRPLPLRTTLVGRIVAMPMRRGDRTIVVVEAERVGGAPAAGLVRLGIRRPTRRWRFGERLRARTTLRAPRNFDNPGGFDWAGHLARRGIRVTGGVWAADDVVRLPARVRGVRAAIERRRERIARTIARVLPGPEGGVLRALVVGDERGIDDPVRDAFARAGVVHVLSISGLHVGLVAGAAFVLFRWCLTRSLRLLRAVDVDRAAAVLCVAPVLGYAALAGLGVATVRAALMVVAAGLAAVAGRRVDVLGTLALAALVLALAWPGAPLEIAFQLSFASVAAIVLGTRRFAGGPPGWRRRLRAAALVSPIALVGTAPLVAWHFQQVSLIGVVANPLVVPLFGTLAIGPGLVGAAVEPWSRDAAGVLLAVAGLAVRLGMAVTDALARPAWAAVHVPMPNAFEVVLLYAAAGGLLLGPPRRRIVLAVSLAALALDVGWWVHQRIGRDALRVSFLDVGQGDAAVVELPGGGVVVVDGGGFPASDFDVGAAVVAPFLHSRKVLRLDAVAMTHAHPDHAAGLASVVDVFRPREFWWTGVPGDGAGWLRLLAALARSGTRERRLVAGSSVPIGGASIAVLHPPAGPGWAALNDSSLTLRVGVPPDAVLLTGDIERRAEAALLRRPELLAAGVVKVPHHGSRTSSTPPFVAATAPRVAVISLGHDNRYAHPAPEVEARWRDGGACVLRTDVCGAVVATLERGRLRAAGRRCACPPDG